MKGLDLHLFLPVPTPVETGGLAVVDLREGPGGDGVSRMETAYRSLRPGGIVCVIARNRLTAHRRSTLARSGGGTTLAALGRAVEGAGFRTSASYGLFPTAEGSGAIIPLTDAAALRFYYRTRVAPSISAVAASVLDAGLRGGLAKHMVPAFLIVASKPDAAATKPVGSFLLDHLAREWSGLFGGPAPSRIRLAKVSSRPGPRSTVSLLLFRDGEQVPFAVLKINRDPAHPGGVRREFENLSSIYGRLRRCRQTVPRPLFCENIGDHVVLGETVIAGHPVAERTFRRPEWFRRRRVARLVNSAFDWLQEFHAETAMGAVTIDEAFVREQCGSVFEAVLAQVPESSVIARDLWWVTERLGKFQGTALPRTAIHGDFTYANILLAKASVGVVDWEDCQPQGCPLIDVFFFLCQLGFDYAGGLPTVDRFREFLLGDGPVLRQVLKRMEGYAARFGFDPRIFGLLLPQFIASLLLLRLPDHREAETYRFRSFECLRAAVELSRRIA